MKGNKFFFKTCIMNWLSCIRWLLANWLRSNGMHDRNNGQSLSHLKWDCLSDSSPSSVSIDSMRPVLLSESIASALNLSIVMVTLSILVISDDLSIYNSNLHQFKRVHPSCNDWIGCSNGHFIILQVRRQQFHQMQRTIFDSKS